MYIEQLRPPPTDQTFEKLLSLREAVIHCIVSSHNEFADRLNSIETADIPRVGIIEPEYDVVVGVWMAAQNARFMPIIVASHASSKHIERIFVLHDYAQFPEKEKLQTKFLFISDRI